MNTRAVEIAVGAFVAAGLAALLMLAMQVSNLSAYGDADGYEVVALFDNIGGLKERAPVRIGGVRIGQVKQIGYDEQRYQAVVTLTIRRDFDQLPEDSSASIFTSGLLGEQYIGLEPGAAEGYLGHGDTIHQTQSALVLEQLIGQFLFSRPGDGGQP